MVDVFANGKGEVTLLVTHNINVTVMSYSADRFQEIYNQISDGRKPIECIGKKYKLNF